MYCFKEGFIEHKNNLYIVVEKKEKQFSKTNLLSTNFREKKLKNILEDLNGIFDVIKNEDEVDVDSLIFFSTTNKINSYFKDNYKRIFNSFVNKILNNYCDFDIKDFCNKSKKTHNSVFLNEDEMEQLIKLIIINKLCFGLTLTEINSNSMIFLRDIYDSCGVSDNLLKKMYDIVSFSVKKMSITNTFLWKLYQNEFGSDNHAFTLKMYNELLIKSFINFKLKENVSPISFYISNINNQINWWINHKFSLRMLNTPENENFNIMFSNAVVYDINNKMTPYENVVYKRFITKITEFIYKIKIDPDEFKKIKEIEKEYKLSIISKYIISYMIGYIFDFDYKNIFNLSMFNENMGIKFLLILKKLHKGVEENINVRLEELDPLFVSTNIFVPKHKSMDNLMSYKNEIASTSEEVSLFFDFVKNEDFKYIERELFGYVFEKIDKSLVISKTTKLPLFELKTKVPLYSDKYIRYIFMDIFYKNVFPDSNSREISEEEEKFELYLTNLKKCASDL